MAKRSFTLFVALFLVAASSAHAIPTSNSWRTATQGAHAVRGGRIKPSTIPTSRKAVTHRKKAKKHRRPEEIASTLAQQASFGPGMIPPAAVEMPSYYVAPFGTATLSNTTAQNPMSLQTAVNSVPAGATVAVAAGSYPTVTDTAARSSYATFTGQGDATEPIIAGANLYGAQFIRFSDVAFTAEVHIDWSSLSTVARPGQVADHVQIIDSEVNCGSTQTRPFTQGLVVRHESDHVTFSGDYIHNCVVGFGSVAQDPISTDITIEDCTFEDLQGDGIDLGGVEGVIIDHNIIRDISDPAALYHDDGIQFFGNDQNVKITNNVLANSRDQLIFIQDAVKSAITRSSVNRNILIAQNLVYGAGSFAVQDQGGQNVVFVNNTLWDNHYGSLLVTVSNYTGLSPTLALTNNILQGVDFVASATARVDSHNLLADVSATSHSWSPTDLLDAQPTFVDAAEGDFALAANSLGIGFADATLAQALMSGDSTLETDMFGLTPPAFYNIGALQSDDPDNAYGALEFGPAPLQ
jgi:hypothetical protein